MNEFIIVAAAELSRMTKMAGYDEACTLIPAPGEAWVANFWVGGQLGLYKKFQGSQGYIVKPYLSEGKDKGEIYISGIMLLCL